MEKFRGDYTPRARTGSEAEFLAIGGGAGAWLKEVAVVGTSRMNVKIAEAVSLAKIGGVIDVDRALGTAAILGRFAHGDLASILQAGRANTLTRAANEGTSLTPGTSAWAANTTANTTANGG
ncbi:hypothetical protein [Arthrobacter sp. ERGS1:01]|uniref:hypothetical protein n=1 Tax=Arthrobacter sp. ERGS1:01 TaxID=1704044 RepID=UPI0006B48FCC|nr:hypothetical protein [Arthrobacter sp. ERGS1:01]